MKRSPVRSRSSSLAKNTLADFKISFARRNSNFSARSRRISSRSCAVGRSGARPIRLDWRTFLRSVSEWHTEIAATCAIGRPDLQPQPVTALEQLIGYFFGPRINGSTFTRTYPGFSLRQTRHGSYT